MTPTIDLMSLRMGQEQQALKEIQDEADKVVMGVFTPSVPDNRFSNEARSPEMIRLVARDSSGLGFDVLKGNDTVGRDFLTVEDIASMHGDNLGGDRLQLCGMSPVVKALKAVQAVALKVPEADPRKVMELALDDPGISNQKPEAIRISMESLTSEPPELNPHRPQLKPM